MSSRWRLNYSLAQLMLVVVMVANVCGVIVAVRADLGQRGADVVGVRVSADGRKVAAFLEDGRAVVCDAATGKVEGWSRLRWPRHSWARHLAGDCNTVATVRADGSVEFGQLQTTMRWKAEVPSAPLRAAITKAVDGGPGLTTLSDNAAVFALAYADSAAPGHFRVAVWDVGTGKLSHTLTVAGDAWSIALSPDGKTLAIEAQSLDGPHALELGLYLRDVATGRQRARRPTGDGGGVAEMEWAADSDTLFWVSRAATGAKPSVRSIRVSDGRQRHYDLCLDDRSRTYSLCDGLLISADGRTVAVSNPGYGVLFLDAARLTPLGKRFLLPDQYHSSDIQLVGLSADGKELATTSWSLGELCVRMFDQEGKFRRDLVLLERHESATAAAIAINVCMFLLCLWLIVKQARRRRAAPVPAPSATA
jgi:WD40 repeat protein